MKMIGRRPRPSLLLLWLTCTLAISSCATTSPPVTPPACPKPSLAPSNVMRAPNYVQRLQALLFKSSPKLKTTSAPVNASSASSPDSAHPPRPTHDR